MFFEPAKLVSTSGPLHSLAVYSAWIPLSGVLFCFSLPIIGSQFKVSATERPSLTTTKDVHSSFPPSPPPTRALSQPGEGKLCPHKAGG